MDISKVSLSEKYKDQDKDKKRAPASGRFALEITVDGVFIKDVTLAATYFGNYGDLGFFMQAELGREGDEDYGLLEFRGHNPLKKKKYEIKFEDVDTWFKLGTIAGHPFWKEPAGEFEVMVLGGDGQDVDGHFKFDYEDQDRRKIGVTCKSFTIRYKP